MPNYQNGKIYIIKNSVNDIVYIGSTTYTYLCQRMHAHRHSAKSKQFPLYVAMRTIGVDNFTISLLKLYPCDSRDALEAEEQKEIDAQIASGKVLYNSMVQGKHSEETKSKMVLAHFAFGSISLRKNGIYSDWVFQYKDADGKNCTRSFAIKRYGNYGAHFRAEEVRRSVYPEWGNDEDIYCDDLGHIEW